MEDGSAPTRSRAAAEPKASRPAPTGTRAEADREPGHGTGAGRPTIDEVARVAGVGRGTASRVLNGSPQVSDSAREAVLRAVDELGYVPNRAARSLVTRRTDTVALVVSEDGERLFGDPYFAATVRGIHERLGPTHFQLVLTLAGHDTDRARVVEYLTDQHVDGVLLLSLHADDDLADRLESRGLPTVCAGRPAQRRPVCVVDADNHGGGRMAVEHLLERGRRTVATITGPQDMSSGVDRLAGAREAWSAAGLPDRGLRVVEGDYSEASGEAAMRALLAGGPRPDAVFAAADLMAVGALRVLREAGLRVPEDVALVGFDDAPVCRHADPELTTVRQPVEEMGAVMVDLLLARIAGREVAAETVLPTALVVRASS